MTFPTKNDFGFCRMKPNEQEIFTKWYDTQEKSFGYDLEKEMVSYCIDDVKVLIESIGAYRKQFKAITQLDPTTRHYTLASIGMETFRAKQLEPNLLGKTPALSYAPETASMTEEAWLNIMEDVHKTTIFREFPIGKYQADGVSLDKKIIYEYLGCRWHGCSCMFKNDTDIMSERDKKTVAMVRAHDKRKFDFYRKVLPGFQIEVAKDCDNRYSLETHAELGRISKQNKKLEALGLPRYLELRRALKGGRTNNARFYFESDGTNEMKYYDFTSLYPTVVKQEKYPMHHPTRITRKFDKTLEKYFGLVYCSVDAPKQMRFPVLGDTYNNKFIFALCRTCAEKQNDSSCLHSGEERRLYGVWTTEELKKAIEHGYVIHEIFEVLHYDSHSNTLFRDYVDMWQREKQEAEGWKNYVTPDERAK